MNTHQEKSIALMQPYFFPYLGYFQLITVVDEFILYDDVQYMKGGWVNRNRILENGKPVFITLPVEKGSVSDLIINKKLSALNRTRVTRKLIKRIDSCYRTTPFFDTVFPILENILQNDTHNLAEFLEYSLRTITSFLNIETPITVSSTLRKNDSLLKGQDRVLHICKNMNATKYVNAIGGQTIYDDKSFKDINIELRFLKPSITSYVQRLTEFTSNLSIIDVMMFNSVETLADKLQEFDLV